MLFSCQPAEINATIQVTNCDTVTTIEGEYSCYGECITIGSEGNKEVKPVTGETDVIKRFPNAKEQLYQVDISNGDFREVEIGVLTALTMRTATADVSDGQYPVLEEYVFNTGTDCNATGFTKIVRNPDPELFKTCVIICKKNN